MARTTRHVRGPRAPRTPRSSVRRSPAAHSRALRTRVSADSAAPPTDTCRCPGSRREVVRVLRQVLGALLGDEHEVFEAHAAVALAVAARLDGDHVARPERVLRREAHAGLLVHLEPDSVAEPVEEAVGKRLAFLL